MRNRKLAITILAFAVVGTLALSAVYEGWLSMPVTRSARIAVDVWVGFAPLYLAQEKGYFKARGVEVSLITMKGAEEIRAGLAARQLDGQTTSLDTILMQNDQGVPAVAVLALDRSDGGDGIVAGSGVRTVAGLTGKTVAFQPATPSHFFLMYHLDKAGMTIKDINGVHMDSGDAGAAFVAGKVDAAVTWEPWLTKASTIPGAAVIASSRGDDTVIVDVLAFRPEFIREHEKDVRAIAASWNDAVGYWKEHPLEANALMAKHYNLSPTEFADMISGLRYLDMDGNRALIGTIEAPGPLMDLGATINRIFLKNGVTHASHALNEIIGFNYL